MRVAFILKTITVSSPLGIMYLSAALKKEGHETALFYFRRRDFLEKLKRFKPDILAYSITTGAHREYIALNRKIKKSLNAVSVFGGPHPTFYPEMIEENGVDAICRGEGEEAFVEFVNKLEKGKSTDRVKNFWIKRGKRIIKNPVRKLKENLDELPFPDREVVYKTDRFFLDFKMKRFMASRGCPFKCTYCFNRQYNQLYKNKGRIVRCRSVDNLLEEIKQVKSRYPTKLIKFVDDTFILDKIWLEEFCDKYRKEIGLPFICNIRADLVTEDIVEQLKKAMCIAVYIGIESGNEKARREVLERNMSDEQILNACRLFRKYGIKIIAQNMLGLPGET
ncbi:MAG: radical SAM protein, partial [Nanoarchaeota archaeon]